VGVIEQERLNTSALQNVLAQTGVQDSPPSPRCSAVPMRLTELPKNYLVYSCFQAHCLKRSESERLDIDAFGKYSLVQRDISRRFSRLYRNTVHFAVGVETL
jgi:hypothetical protein